MSLLRKVQVLCSKNNLSLASLERQLGFSKGSVHKWDTNSPSIDKVSQVADFFGVSTDYLLDRNYDTEFVYMIQRLKDGSEIELGERDLNDIYNFIKFKYAEASREQEESGH